MNNIEFKLMREELHLTQTDLADIWGINLRNIQRWEKGDINPPEDKCKLLSSYFDDVELGVRHFLNIINQNEGKPNDTIILLAYNSWTYDGDFPHYKIHNALLIKCKQAAQTIGFNVRICPFDPQEYEDWLNAPIGSEEDTPAKRATWASEYYHIFSNVVDDLDAE